MTAVSRVKFDRALGIYARFGIRDDRGRWCYYEVPERRIGVFDGSKCMIEDEIWAEMCASGGQKRMETKKSRGKHF